MMQKQLVEAVDGGYHHVHISRDDTCYIPGIGKCKVTRERRANEYYDPFAYRIVKVIEPPRIRGQ